MKRGAQGQWLKQTVASEPFRAFIPASLPPEPPVRLEELSDLLEQANRALGKLHGVALLLPDISIFLYLYVRKEAVLSSQIEGTKSSLSDLLLYESEEVPGIPLEDVGEVSQEDFVAVPQAVRYGCSMPYNAVP
jgi:hypothetical protein